MALAMLERSGFKCSTPKGAYYIMTDISAFGFANDVAMARHLVERIGIAAVPGSSFFHKPEFGSQMIRFCFPKKYETLKEQQEQRLSKLYRLLFRGPTIGRVLMKSRFLLPAAWPGMMEWALKPTRRKQQRLATAHPGHHTHHRTRES